MDEQTTEKQTADISLYIRYKCNDNIQFLWIAKVRYDALADTSVKWKKKKKIPVIKIMSIDFSISLIKLYLKFMKLWPVV